MFSSLPISPILPYTTLFRSDPLDLIDGQVGKIECSRRRTLHPHAVDQDLHLGGTRPPYPDLRELAETPGALDLETRSEEHTSEIQSLTNLVWCLLFYKNM